MPTKRESSVLSEELNDTEMDHPVEENEEQVK